MVCAFVNCEYGGLLHGWAYIRVGLYWNALNLSVSNMVCLFTGAYILGGGGGGSQPEAYTVRTSRQLITNHKAPLMLSRPAAITDRRK